MSDDSARRMRSNPWRSQGYPPREVWGPVVRACLIGLLTACLAFSLVTVLTLLSQSANCLSQWRHLPSCRLILGRITAPGRHEAVLALLAGLAATEGFAIAALAFMPRRSRLWGIRWWLVEASLIIGAVLVAAVAFDPASRALFPALGSGLLALAAWAFARTLAQLSEPGAARPDDERGVPAKPGAATAPVLLGSSIAMGAAGLVARTVAPDLPHVAAGPLIVAATVYVVTGIALLSLLRHAWLRREWNARAAVVAPNLAVSWTGWAVVLLGAVALAGFVMPAIWPRASSAIFDPIGRLALLLFGGFADQLARLGSFYQDLRTHRRVPPAARGGPQPGRVPKPLREHGTNHAIDMVTHAGAVVHAAIWFVPLVVVAILLWRATGHAVPGADSLRSLTRALRGLWARLSRGARRVVDPMLERTADLLPDPYSSGVGPRVTRFLQRSALSPRDDVRRLYLNGVEYARLHGVQRGGSQTVDEFTDTIVAAVDREQAAIETLASTFSQARYSNSPIDISQVVAARAALRGMRTALRAGHREDRGSSRPDAPSL